MSEFQWVAVAVIAVTSAARITRLFTYDTFPPIAYLRDLFDDLTTDDDGDRSGWNLLLHCGYCFSFWATCAILAWGYCTDWQTAWWLVNAVFGGSYLAAILMANDGEA